MKHPVPQGTERRRDVGSGLQYMNARFYQPSTGRFLSQDRTGSPYDPWTQHLYSYCGNNPINMIDPTGFAAYRFVGYGNDPMTTPGQQAKITGRGNDIATTTSSQYAGRVTDMLVAGGSKDRISRKNRNTRRGNDTKSRVSYGEIQRQNELVPTIEAAFAITDARNFNWENTDENVVLNSYFFSAYKGKLVIRQGITEASFSIAGTIWLHYDSYDINDVRHEWGHLVQEDELGIWDYMLRIAIPSMTHRDAPDEYYSNPWERGADYLGGVVDRKQRNGEDYDYKITPQEALDYMYQGRHK